jgi:hypothetical protein
MGKFNQVILTCFASASLILVSLFIPAKAQDTSELAINESLRIRAEEALRWRDWGIVGKKPNRSTNRRITVSADMYVEDDETFGSNETVRRQKTNYAILSAKGISQSVMDFEVRMGGEIRVEFTVNASLLDVQGNAVLDGEVKLYEGTSESTGDLDGVRQFQLYCPIGKTINYFVRVNNDDEGGDYATIRLTVTNASA